MLGKDGTSLVIVDYIQRDGPLQKLFNVVYLTTSALLESHFGEWRVQQCQLVSRSNKSACTELRNAYILGLRIVLGSEGPSLWSPQLTFWLPSAILVCRIDCTTQFK